MSTTSVNEAFATYRTGAKRIKLPHEIRRAVIERDRGLCVYCSYFADVVDHVVPWSYGGAHTLANLVACCSVCNAVAGDKCFDSFDDKRDFIRDKYGPLLAGREQRRRRKISVCADCNSVFKPRVDGASAVLCGPCYKEAIE